MKVIARIHSDFKEKFGIPRQSGLVPEAKAKIVFEPEYRVADALRGIEEYSHLWLIWSFSKAERDTWSPTVRPPRLGGNKRVGVFATRSPFRPNAVGLSSVTLEEVRFHTPEGPVLIVGGADLMDGTSTISSPICPMWTATRMRAAASAIRMPGMRLRYPCRTSSAQRCRKIRSMRCLACWRATRAPLIRATPSAYTAWHSPG